MSGSSIAFWGPVHGQVATTSNILAAASILGSEYIGRKTIVTHTHWSHSTLERGYFKNNSLTENSFINFTDIGLDALARFARSRKLEPEMIKDYTHHIVNQLDLLYGTTKSDENADALVEDIKNIFDNCRLYYDLTLIDVNSGSQNKATNTVLQNSDLIVVCLSQNTSLLDRFFIEKEWDHVIGSKQFIIVLGQYDKYSHYTHANISRKYKYKNPIYTVPHCSHYMDAYNQSAVAEFFMRNRKIDRRDEDFFFFEEVRRLTKGILTEVGLNGKLQTDRGA
jgi:hypothetical protein